MKPMRGKPGMRTELRPLRLCTLNDFIDDYRSAKPVLSKVIKNMPIEHINITISLAEV